MSAAVPRKTNWPGVLALCGAGVAAALQIGKMPAALPVLRAEFGFDLTMAALLLSLLTVAAAAVGMAVGLASDRLGHRRLIHWGLALCVAANLLGAAAPGVEALLAARLVESMGFIAVVVAGPPLMPRLAAPRDLRAAIALWSCYMPAGMGLMLLIALPALTLVGWRGLWLIGAGLTGLVWIGLHWTVRAVRELPAAERRAGAIGPAMRRTASAPGPLMLGAIFGFYAGIYLTVLGFLPTILTEQLGWAPGFAAAMTGIAVAVNILGNLTAGWLLSRGVPRGWLLAGAGVAIALLVPWIYLPVLPGEARFAVVLVYSAICGLVPSSLFAGVAPLSPTPALMGATSGLMMQGSQIGQLIAPPLAAKAVEWAGDWVAALVVLMPSAAAVVVLGLALGRLERHIDREARAAGKGGP